MIDFHALILIFLLYLSVSLNTYKSFKKAGLFDGEIDQSKKYYLFVLFWPAYTNPVKLMVETIFKNYGDTNSTYTGWDGLKNFLNDIVKGRNRYKSYDHHTFQFKVEKSPDPDFEKFKQVFIHVAKKDKTLLMLCSFSEEPLKDFSFSRFELDRCGPVDHQELISKLQSLHVKYQDIEIVTAAIHRKGRG